MTEGAGGGRRDRRGGDRGAGARHGGSRAPESFGRSFTTLGELAVEGASVSVAVRDLDGGDDLLSIDETVALPVAQVGALLLLVEVSAQIESGRLGALDELERLAGPGDRAALGGGGVWSYLQRRALAVTDAAALVGALRDPAAVNALVGRVGLDAVRARADGLGLVRTALLDEVRAERGPDDAPALAVGTAVELVGLMTRLTHGEVVDEAVSSRVLGWLSLGVDLSLVAGSFGLDPVSHRRLDHGLQLVNTVGVSPGTRSELGVLRGPARGVAYAVTVAFDDLTLARRLRVVDALRALGTDLLEHVH
ncbi:beta-lactamase class A [Frigoribacterium sp. PvP120]|uniref:serine hydrolase n=1 Tax=unclassified Frigoribacterium TaxID=2627005 RepID=UPI001AE51675|nr:serine hydrolase [Frigoribacterium sp. PvP121]MBP1240257.1 beta-lactamase class A [Frigoribacterium sp. PvP121]